MKMFNDCVFLNMNTGNWIQVTYIITNFIVDIFSFSLCYVCFTEMSNDKIMKTLCWGFSEKWQQIVGLQDTKLLTWIILI